MILIKGKSKVKFVSPHDVGRVRVPIANIPKSISSKIISTISPSRSARLIWSISRERLSGFVAADHCDWSGRVQFGNRIVGLKQDWNQSQWTEYRQGRSVGPSRDLSDRTISCLAHALPYWARHGWWSLQLGSRRTIRLYVEILEKARLVYRLP